MFNLLGTDLTSERVYTQLAPELIRMLQKDRVHTSMRTWENVLSDQDIEDVVALFAA